MRMLRTIGELQVYETTPPKPPLTDPEKIRLDAISQIRQHREDFLDQRQSAEKLGRARKAVALFPLVAALGVTAIPGFKHQSRENRLIDEAYIVLYSSIAFGGVEGARRGILKRSKDFAKEAREISGQIGRIEDVWITDALGPPVPELEPEA